MKSVTFRPSPDLAPYVDSLVITESDGAHTYIVLPRTAPVIGLQYTGKIWAVKDEQPAPLSAAGITGLHDSYRLFGNSAGTGSVLIYFKPGGARAFFREPAHAFFRESVALDDFLVRSHVMHLQENLSESPNDESKIIAVETFLRDRLIPPATDNLAVAAAKVIMQRRGTIAIRELAKTLYVSQSPLEKKFREAIGTSPKKFAAIVRFTEALAQHSEHSTLTALAHAAGYYDQAHFIKDFQRYTGVSPEKYLRKQ